LVGAIGASLALGSLLVTGGTIQSAGASTTGAQTYQGATSLSGSYVTQGGDFGVTGAAQLGGATTVTTNGGQASFGGTLDGARDLTINAAAGGVNFVGAIGASQALASLLVTGGTIQTAGASTTGAQTYQGATSLNGNYSTQGGDFGVTGAAQLGGATTVTTNGGQASFGGTLDGARDLTVNATAGGASFGGAVGTTTRLGALAVNSSGATRLGASVRAASVSTDAAGSLALNGGAVDTSGTQTYGERAVLGANTTLTGTTVTLSAGADASAAGAQALTVTGNASFGAALGANQTLTALTVTGASSLGGNVTTVGDQSYAGATTLTSNAALQGNGVSFASTLDGARDLTVNAAAGGARFDGAVGNTTRLGAMTINSSGATRLGASVRAASVSTDAAGSLTLTGGSVDTSGAQTYGEPAVLGANTTLSGTTISLSAGADASAAGAQSLVITGNANFGAALGANQALNALTVTGTSNLGGNVTTSGDQSYSRAVAITEDATLRSLAGSLVFGSTIDSPAARALTLRADAGTIEVAGDVGATSGLGAFALRGGTTTSFGASVTADQITQTEGGSTQVGGAVLATGAGGVQLSARGLQFDSSVSAQAGDITLALSDNSGTIRFEPSSTVRAATGFVQTAGAAIAMPAAIEVARGPISIQAPASSGNLTLSTDGLISLTGLNAAQSVVILNAGSGALKIGTANSGAALSLVVGKLQVGTAGSASLYGSIGGQGGAIAASRITSSLVGAPYFMNDTPWGPTAIIATITATTVPTSVVASTPGLSGLFTGVLSRADFAPNALQAYRSPAVLTIAPLPMNITPSIRTGPAFVPTPGREREDLEKNR
jgi:hypothetical protein